MKKILNHKFEKIKKIDNDEIGHQTKKDSEKILLEVKDLQVNYGMMTDRTVLKDFNLSIFQDEIVTLLGPSGCGKSTLLNCIAGFNKHSRGEIKIDGKMVQSNVTFIPSHMRQLGMVFQDHALFSHMTVYDNIVFALSARGQKRDKIRIDFLIENFKLQELLKRYPHEISGGQQQQS